MNPSSTPIAFIGLGIMGQGMSRRLLDAGYPVRVFNRTPEKMQPLVEAGATAAQSAAEACRGARFAIIMVDNDRALAKLMRGESGAIAGLESDATFIQMSTINPELTSELAGEVEEVGANFLDAPVFGSKDEAAQGKLWIMAGGDEEIFKRCQPILECMGQSVDYFGPIGSGATMKLCGNLLVAQMVSGLAQSLTLGRKAGLDPKKMLALINKVDFRSPLYEGIGQSMVQQDFDPKFSVRNMLKDIKLLVDAGQHLGVPMPGPDAALGLFEQAMEQGLGDKNVSALISVMEKASGLPKHEG